MSATIVPFTADHVEQAAALLAARHRGDRARAPDLPPQYEDPAACLPIVQELLAADGTSGVVALCAGKIVGCLLGAPELGSPTRPFAGFTHPRSAEIAYRRSRRGSGRPRGHLGAALCHARPAMDRGWPRRSLHHRPRQSRHDGNLVGSRLQPLHGVGRAKTSPSDERCTQQTMNLVFRRATDADEEAIQALVTDMFRAVVEPPIFLPFLPETTAERRRLVAEHLADPACPYWLAFAGDRLVAMQMFEEPHSTRWHQSPLPYTSTAVCLFLACTAPKRGAVGIGAALFAHNDTLGTRGRVSDALVWRIS